MITLKNGSKKKKKQKKVLTYVKRTDKGGMASTMFCGFRRVKGSYNGLWNLKTLEDVSVQAQ